MSYIIGVVSDNLLIGNKDKKERLKERRNYNKHNKQSIVIIFLGDKKIAYISTFDKNTKTKVKMMQRQLLYSQIIKVRLQEQEDMHRS